MTTLGVREVVPADLPEFVNLPLIPRRLKARLEYYRAELPPFVPIFDRIFVYPLDTADQPETTAGGIVLAKQTKEKLGAQRGILVMAGAKAMEQLYSHGVNIGDIVITARLSPWERSYYSKDKRPHRVLVLRAAEVVADEDLYDKYESGDWALRLNVADGTVTLDDRVRVDPPENDEGI
jgi:co-chaperonin GroES (HSP10)